MAFKILSIDGGGIRGIIPAVVLGEIEKITGKPISSLFDLVAGTSTGGILALGLAKPKSDGSPEHSAQKLVGLYDSEGSHIFRRSFFHKILSLGNLSNAKYPTSGLEDALDRYFGEAMLSETLVDLVIPSYDIEKRLPIYFTSYFARGRPGFDHKMRYVAQSTASAPTYFKPFKLKTGSEVGHLSLIDGGVFANNPTLAALSEATGSRRARIGNLFIVSLGTGQGAQPISLKRATNWGLVGWATRILDVVLDSVSQSVHHQIYYLLRGTKSQQSYYRLQPLLEKGERRLDNATPSNIAKLKKIAQGFVRDNKGLIEEICREVEQ
ncbi:MAG: patatin-like phospholipase family protein [Desulfobacterales bacterium]